ncbi:hypothetical protein GOODEAATRI_034201 [Goodea atripinnis]|uniref:Uncharacterized protein n=1 Tax=Goodea atripinnis TaxID=208336 RepID=A0ABV0PTX9_9TELE
MRTHKNTHTHAPNVKTNNNGRLTLTYTPHAYSQVQVLISQRGNQPQTQEVVPFPAGVETGRPPQHQPRLVSALPEPEQPGPGPPAPNDHHPRPERGPSTKERSTWTKLARQPELPPEETVPIPQQILIPTPRASQPQ